MIIPENEKHSLDFKAMFLILGYYHLGMDFGPSAINSWLIACPLKRGGSTGSQPSPGVVLNFLFVSGYSSNYIFIVSSISHSGHQCREKQGISIEINN